MALVNVSIRMHAVAMSAQVRISAALNEFGADHHSDILQTLVIRFATAVLRRELVTNRSPVGYHVWDGLRSVLGGWCRVFPEVPLEMNACLSALGYPLGHQKPTRAA